MKFLKKMLFAALPLVLVLLSACSDKPTNLDLTFKTTPEVTDSQIKVAVKPSADDIQYYANIVESESIKDLKDVDLAAKMIAADDFNSKLQKGVQSLTFANLRSETAYSLILFGTDGKDFGAVTVIEYKTSALEKGENPGMAIKIEVSDITSSSATVTVIPTDDNVEYYYNYLPKSELVQNGKLVSGKEFIAYYGQDPSIPERRTFKGKQVFKLERLAPKLTFMVACYDLSQKIYVEYKEFTTLPLEFVADQFVIDNIKATTNGVTYDVTPKDDKQFYCTWVTTLDTYNDFDPATYIQGAYYALNNIAVDKRMTMADYVKSIAKQGKSSWSNFDGPLKPNTDHVIVAFYIDPNNADQLSVYDWSYTKATFKTEATTEELDIIIGNITEIKDNGDGSANVSVHLKSVGAVECRAGAKLASDVDSEIAKGISPETWSDWWISARANVQVDQIQTASGADMVIPVVYDSTNDMYLIVRVKGEQGGNVTKYIPLKVTK